MPTTCLACQATLTDGMKFCGQCGASLIQTCATCGATAPAGQRFCGSCGALLGENGGATRPETAPGSPAGMPPAAPLRASVPDLSGPLPMGVPLPPAAVVEDAGPRAGRRVVTVLFTDVSGFTSMSEKLDAERVTDLMNSFFQVLVEPIYRYGGVVDKYIGDAIMAVFGAPIAHEDDAVRAVWAAWDMQTRAGRFARDLEAQTGIVLKIRVGLNTGIAVYSDVGARQRHDFTVMGDAVNLAQRMEANARPGGVLVSGETFNHARHAFRFVPLDPIKVKGKAQPIPVFELAGPHSATAALGSPDLFLGREGELARLAAPLKDAGRGRPQLAIVSAEAGMGKSSLVRRFLSSASCRDAIVYRARCNSFDQGSDFALARKTLLALLGLPGQADGQEIAAHLAKFVAGRGNPDPRAEGFLRHLAGLDPGGAEAPDLGPEQLRTGAFVHLNDLVCGRAAAETVILSLVDVHWADEASLDWLASLWDRLTCDEDKHRLLILCETRPDRAPPAPGPGSGVELTALRLLPLAATEARALAGLILGTSLETLAPPARAVADTVLDRAEGNPFFLTELLRSATEGGALVQIDKSWVPGRPGAEREIPASIQGAIAARLDRLPPALRRFVDAAAVLGRRFDVRVLETVVGAGARASLAEGVRRKLFYARPDGEAGFSQTALQEGAYESLLHASRRDLHRQIGLALEQSLGAAAAGQAPLLAHHFVRAEDAPKAARYLLLAGDRAREAFSPAQAAAFYRAGLEWADRAEGWISAVPRAEIVLRLARTQADLGHSPEALALLEECSLAGHDSAPARCTRADLLRKTGDLAGALAEFRAAAGMARDPVEAAAALIGQGNVCRQMGDHKGAISLARRAQIALEEGGRVAEAAPARGLIGICYWRLGELELARAEHEAALRARERAGDWSGMASSLNNLGILATAQGRLQEAVGLYTRGLEIARKLGNLRTIGMMLGNLCEVHLTRGDAGVAERHARKALDLARKTGDPLSEIICSGNLALAGLARGEGGPALDLLDQCLAIIERTGHRESEAEIHCYRGRALQLLGRDDEARLALLRARGQAAASGNDAFAGVVDRSLADLADRAGDRARALALALQAEALLRPAGMPLEHGRAQALLARLAPHPRAEEWDRGARATFEQLGAARDLADLDAAGSRTLACRKQP